MQGSFINNLTVIAESLYAHIMTIHTVALGALAQMFQGAHLKKKERTAAGSSAVVVRIQNLATLDLSGEFVSEALGSDKIDRFRIRAGQIVVALRSTPLKASVVGTDQEGLVVNSNFAVLTPTSAVDPYFLVGLLRSEAFNQLAMPQRAGALIPSLTLSQLKQLQIPLAPPNVQRHWGTVFRAMERYQQAAQRLLHERERLVEAHIGQLLEGKEFLS